MAAYDAIVVLGAAAGLLAEAGLAGTLGLALREAVAFISYLVILAREEPQA